MVAFVPILVSTAYNIATRTIGKKALDAAIKKYGPTFIKTLQNIGKNRVIRGMGISCIAVIITFHSHDFDPNKT